MLNNMKNNQNKARQIWREFLRNESPELARVAKAVARQMGGVNVETLESLYSISRHSIADGYTGFIYYAETVTFWRKNRAAISALMAYEADSLGENVLGMVTSFNALKGYTPDEIGRALFGNYNSDYTQLYNVFAWYAAEEVAYRFGEYCYDQDIDIYNL